MSLVPIQTALSTFETLVMDSSSPSKVMMFTITEESQEDYIRGCPAFHTLILNPINNDNPECLSDVQFKHLIGECRIVLATIENGKITKVEVDPEMERQKKEKGATKLHPHSILITPLKNFSEVAEAEKIHDFKKYTILLGKTQNIPINVLTQDRAELALKQFENCLNGVDDVGTTAIKEQQKAPSDKKSFLKKLFSKK